MNMLHSLQGVKVKVTSVDKLMGEIQTNFLFTKIAVFLLYREIYVHIFVIIKHTTQHTGVCIV